MPSSALLPFFAAKNWQPFEFQRQTWEAYLAGKSGLLHAPTGLGKTLAVYLGPLAATAATPNTGCQVLWLTPLRALAADTLRALREPLQAILPGADAEARTGDTPAALRARLRKKLPHTLVTTPESLSLMLTHADFPEKIAGLRCVIVDEWHELLGTKRGVQTELCLARLRRCVPDLRVWGLSASLGNLTEARQSLLGDGFENSVEITANVHKPLLLETIIPREIERFPWSGHIGTQLVGQVAAEIEKAHTTLLFTNTRSQTEIWYQSLAGLQRPWSEKIAMHHGSLERAARDHAENGLRDGSLKCVVATSSLDLGVDFSPVDQVIQIGSPKGIARLLQRAGRSGHQPGGVSRIIGVPTHALELIEFAAARDAALAREIESRPPLRKPLDLLVQHLVTCAIGTPFEAAEMRAEILSSHAFSDLTEAEWQWALGFISNGGDALAAYPRYHKARLEAGRYIVDDKALVARHRLSIGTISSDPAVSVKFANGHSLGTVDESFISKIKPGSTFIFAGKQLTLVRLHQRAATVKPAARAGKGQIAIWGGSKMPLSTELSHAIARRLRGHGPASPEMEAVAPILAIQQAWSRLPDDQSLLVEHTRSREGEHLFFYPFAGRLVHEGLAALAALRISRRSGESIHTTQNDYGFSLTARRGLVLDEDILRAALAEQELLDDLLACMNTAELARRQFREIARISGLILQPMPGKKDLSHRELQSSATLLYEVLHRYDAGNLLLLQSQREILEKQLELTRLTAVIRRLQSAPLHLVETAKLSPLAFPLWADRLSATLPAGDAATRLAKMLESLNAAAGGKSPSRSSPVIPPPENPITARAPATKRAKR
jgi:ATP-dependent Lhr-like helicase